MSSVLSQPKVPNRYEECFGAEPLSLHADQLVSPEEIDRPCGAGYRRSRIEDLDPDLTRVLELVSDRILCVPAQAWPHPLQRVEIARFERGLVASQQLRDPRFRIRR
jgi:hypothetical protein